MMRRFLWISLFFFLLISGFLFWKTIMDLAPPPKTLSVASATKVRKVQVLDRQATPLTITYQNDWNIHDYVPLHEIPELLQTIFVFAEDKRFFEHHGPDWQARWHAIWQNLMALQVVRGASTITEQCVRILHPRPRTFWSRWLEGFEATRLEQRFSKADILEFYLNQVPYASQRRGVVQAARYYFDRDLDTLNLKEMMALAALVRAPGRLDLWQGQQEIAQPIAFLAQRLLEAGVLKQEDYQNIASMPLRLHDFQIPVQATHFVNYIHSLPAVHHQENVGQLHTTLDTHIQRQVQKILDQRVQDLQTKNVQHGAVLVVDHHTREVLAWVNAGQPSTQIPGSLIDAVTTPRQPGSTLKPFLYALALEKGWTAATLIADAPLAKPVGTGLHHYHNYSRSYYGPLRLREALGNSLNIPAIRTIQFVGVEQFLQRLHQLEINSLTAPASYYGEGLALGNGGVTLLELVQAYASLADQGKFRPLKLLRQTTTSPTKTIFNPEVSAIIADILSDPEARRREFGGGALLRFPIQTAVKTGTSNDYRDAWSIGFNHRYVVGIWLGNLAQQPMLQVSGASGAALVLRAVFAELNRYEETQPLYISPRLVNIEICRTTGQRAISNCPSRNEWFIAGTEPIAETSTLQAHKKSIVPLRLTQPTTGLQLAMDPRIPDQYEEFALELSAIPNQAEKIEWLMDGEVIGTTPSQTSHYLWSLTKGTHIAQARVWFSDANSPQVTPIVTFYVK